MVSPHLSSSMGGGSAQIIKWTLPISLLVTVLGFWWHSRKKKKPEEEESGGRVYKADQKQVGNGKLVVANGTTPKQKQQVTAGSMDNLASSDLSTFIATVQRLNSLETSAAAKPELIAVDAPPQLNGSVKKCLSSNGALKKKASGGLVIATPLSTPPKRKSSPPLPCTPKTTPSMEETTILSSSVKHLNAQQFVLNDPQFEVEKFRSKRWSEMIEEDEEAPLTNSKPTTDPIDEEAEELQFQIEEVTNSTINDDSSSHSSGSTRRRAGSVDWTQDHTTFGDGSLVIKEEEEELALVGDSHLCNQQQQLQSSVNYNNTKSYSEAAANAEVVEIIHQTRKTDDEQQRDSANHSPNTDAMMTSPCLSDAQSEGSSDSGKGCSEVSRTPAGGSSVSGEAQWCSHDFVLPQHMVGRLIGKGGAFIHRVRTLTHTKMYIKRHPSTYKLKICAVEGLQADIDAALQMVRQRFPLSEYPFLTLDKVSFLSPNALCCPLRPEPFHLQLVEGINNDVSISSLVTAGHFFVQLPSHPTYQSLESLNLLMNTTYNSSQAPLLPAPVENALVAAPAMGGWFRAQIISIDPVTSMCTIKFVDYGGYLTIETSCLRQIRADFLSLPFQAIECALANIVPNTETGDWSEEARIWVHTLTSGHILQAQVYDFSCDNQLPLVYLYTLHESEVVLVNQALVERGFARLELDVAAVLPSTTTTPSEDLTSIISAPEGTSLSGEDVSDLVSTTSSSVAT